MEWIKGTPAGQRQTQKHPNDSSAVDSFDFWNSPDNTAVNNGNDCTVGPSMVYETNSTRAQPYEVFVLGPGPEPTNASSANFESVEAQLTRYADLIFHRGFGAIFGRWVGRNGCPYVNEPTSDIDIPPLKLFAELDACVDMQFDADPSNAVAAAAQRQERGCQIEQSLRQSIRSYAAQWLPTVMQASANERTMYDNTIRDCWRATRKDMLKVINRPSYRSVLALFLFSQTPVPVGISEEEELDGISGVVCIQTAFLHTQQLRERLRSCQIDGSLVSAWSDAGTSPASRPTLTQRYLSLESRAYWGLVSWDTSCSMTFNFRSSLTSGLKGACLEPAWGLARAFLVGSFHPKTEDWRNKGFEVSDETASQIICAAAVCAVYTWRTITSLKEALREGVDEDTLISAWQAFLDATEIFKTTIHPLLDHCQRRLHFLAQAERFNWYEVVLHYYLGILIAVDALEAGSRSDLLSLLTSTRLEAEHEAFNVLKFGLESKYTIENLRPDPDNRSAPRQPMVTSFVAIDPYPHYVVALVRLIHKKTSQQHRQGNLKHEVHNYLSSTLLKALEDLPQTSRAVRSARTTLQDSLHQLDVACASGIGVQTEL